MELGSVGCWWSLLGGRPYLGHEGSRVHRAFRRGTVSGKYFFDQEQRGEPTLEFGLALHVGDVMYGNIGVPERLQFTVIGAAANEASRLAGLCKTLGQSILISSAFPLCFPEEMISLGFHHLRGVEHPQEIFTLSDRYSACPRPCSRNAADELIK